MSNLKIGAKLYAGFGFVLILVVATQVILLWQINAVSRAAAEINDRAASTLQTAQIQDLVLQDLITRKDYMLSNNDLTLLQRQAALDKQIDQAILAATNAAKKREDKAELTFLDGIQRLKAQSGSDWTQVSDLVRNGEAGRAFQMFMTKSAALTQQVTDAIDTQTGQDRDDMAKVAGNAASAASVATLIGIGGLIVTVLVLGCVAVFMARGITRPIKKVSELISDIAHGDGDLTRRIDVTSRDEVGDLSSNFNAFVDNLHGVVEQIVGTTNRVASASEELSATTGQLSSGADAQLQQSQQIASAMHEMSASILEVAKNAHDAASAAKQASHTANSGSHVVTQTIEGIKRIAVMVDQTAEKVAALGESSSQIGEIIGVIDDIADQTNMLALNAAIEAARAGEQGRGFAVVADEVRKLAERTTKATKEISGMITNIQRETAHAVRAMEGGRGLTAEGVEMANKAEAALGEIVRVADRVGGMVTLIATAAEEQSSAAEEINASVEHITTVIRQTDEGVHESAAATEELAQLALEQQGVVGRFKLANSGSRSRVHVLARSKGAKAAKRKEGAA